MDRIVEVSMKPCTIECGYYVQGKIAEVNMEKILRVP